MEVIEVCGKIHREFACKFCGKAVTQGATCAHCGTSHPPDHDRRRDLRPVYGPQSRRKQEDTDANGSLSNALRALEG